MSKLWSKNATGRIFLQQLGTKMAEPEHFTGEVVDDEKFDE